MKTTGGMTAGPLIGFLKAVKSAGGGGPGARVECACPQHTTALVKFMDPLRATCSTLEQTITGTSLNPTVVFNQDI